MGEDAAETPPGGHRPEPRGSVLTYRISPGRGDTLDPLYLFELAREWSTLLANGLPGRHIEKITYEGYELTVEFR